MLLFTFAVHRTEGVPCVLIYQVAAEYYSAAHQAVEKRTLPGDTIELLPLDRSIDAPLVIRRGSYAKLDDFLASHRYSKTEEN